MPLRSDWSGKACPIARSLDLLGDAWTLVILRELFAGNTRFEGLRAELGVADNVLSARLSRMTEAGLVSRVPYGGSVRPRVEYRLTGAGRDALPVLHALARWGTEHTAAPEWARPMAITCTACGQPAQSADWCVTCGQPLTTQSTEWTRPGADGPPVRLAAVALPVSRAVLPPGGTAKAPEKEEDEPVKQWTHFSVTAETERLWRVTFDSPPVNLVTPEMLTEFPELIDQMEAAPGLRVAVFESANPDYFLNHYDTSRVAETPTELGVTGYPLVIDASTRLSRLPVVSIAKVRGRVRGVGSEFTQAMDMRFASERALFGQPETANGNLPGGGGLEHLPRLLGRARALEVALSSDDYPASLAERYGWVNRAVPDSELDGLVDTLARRIASFDKESIAAVKQQVNRYTLPSPEDIKSSYDIYMTSFGWPGSRRRLPAATAAGRNRAGDYEMRLGYHLGCQPQQPQGDTQ